MVVEELEGEDGDVVEWVRSARLGLSLMMVGFCDAEGGAGCDV